MQEKIKNLLREHNTNAYRVAKSTGIPSTCVHDWLNGRCKPKLDKLKKLADYFGVPIDYFLD